MSRTSRTFLLSFAIVWLAFLLPACAGKPAGIEPRVEPTEAEQTGTARAPLTQVTAMHIAPAETAAARQAGRVTPAPTPTGWEETVTIDPTVAEGQDPGLDRLVAQAKEDFGRRLTIPVDQIELLEVQEVVWPDASLGCPQPGMMYAQVITPGYRVVLQAGGQTKEYHADASSFVLLCENPSVGMPSRGPDAAVQDGWPNESRDPDLIIVPPPKRQQ
jgi:hypothetical protein